MLLMFAGNIKVSRFIIACKSIVRDIKQIVLSALMLLGRLEIFPLLLVFTPIFWKAK